MNPRIGKAVPRRTGRPFRWPNSCHKICAPLFTSVPLDPAWQCLAGRSWAVHSWSFRTDDARGYRQSFSRKCQTDRSRWLRLFGAISRRPRQADPGKWSSGQPRLLEGNVGAAVAWPGSHKCRSVAPFFSDAIMSSSVPGLLVRPSCGITQISRSIAQE
jgi:hypothetical protein